GAEVHHRPNAGAGVPDRGIAHVAGGRVQRPVRADPPQRAGRPALHRRLRARHAHGRGRGRRPVLAGGAARGAGPAAGQPSPMVDRQRAGELTQPGAGSAGAAPDPAILRIATRESRLALWQARHVADLLRARYPACAVELLGMTTRGDQIQDRPLAQVGGKGLFTKELEVALLDGRAELAVHSLKDVPMDLPDGFELACVLERADPRDAFVSVRYASLEELPEGAVVGTSSLRRAAQLRERHPRLRIEPLRGNLDTRLAKLDAGG